MSGKLTPATRDALAMYQEENALTLKQLGAQVGRSEAFVSRYLSGKPEGDVAAFEKAVSDMLANAKRKRAWGEVFFHTDAISACETAFGIIREASDVGLIHGAAGIGKTTACKKYAKENSTMIFFTCTEGNGSYHGIINGIATGIDMRKWNPATVKRSTFIREKLDGSGRLIIIDNAQRVTLSGLRFIFDLHDGTGVSVALVGNPEVLDKLRGSDQMTSRIGFKQDIGEVVKGNWLDRAAGDMVAAMWPVALADIGRLASESARKQGHLRTLNKQLKIAIRLCETPAFAGNCAKAFVQARHLIGADTSDE